MHYTGTQKQCEDYNNLVNKSQNYAGTTTKWSEVIEIEGQFFIAKHPLYWSEMDEVNELPIQNELL